MMTLTVPLLIGSSTTHAAWWMLHVGAPQPSGHGDQSDGHGGAILETVTHSAAEPILFFVVMLGVLTVFVGMCLALYRLLRGPHLADRVLAGDVFALHVVALVILLTIQLRTTVFFDAALVVAIIGFASTLAFAQYIGRGSGSDHGKAASS